MSGPVDRHLRKRASDLPLPVIGGSVRPSRNAKRRAAVLAMVHIAIIVHVIHWWYAGSSLSPVEPSEAMETLETGRVNAGAVFLAVTLLATLVLGRFLCGWGCHLVAYQDLCGWIMKRLGVRPRLVRMRLLGLAPLFVAFYMFAWPSVERWWRGNELPAWSNHVLTNDLWRTFPGPVTAAVTFVVCGFAMVYFLGAKGFCTYGCPYGALYGLAETVAPARVRVTDACDRTGHCTRVCTSNVDVAAEVAAYGMVVNPGCMRCLDCVSVCPNDALHYGVGVPPLFGKARAQRAPRPAYDYSWPEEFILLGVFAVSLCACRGLYGSFPLLMTVGFSGITAYVALQGLRLIRRRDVTIRTWVLKREGRVGSVGALFALLCGAQILFVAHSGFIKYHQWRGDTYLAGTGLDPWMVSSAATELPPHTQSLVQAAEYHLRLTDRWSLVRTAVTRFQLAGVALLRGDDAAAEVLLASAVDREPRNVRARLHYARLLLRRDRADQASEQLRQAVELDPTNAEAGDMLARLLLKDRQFAAVRDLYERRLARAPGNANLHYQLGGVLLGLNERDRGVQHLQEALRLAPEFAEAHYTLGGAMIKAGRLDEAYHRFRDAVRLRPAMAVAQYNLAVVLRMMGRSEEAREHVQQALLLDPADPQTHLLYATMLRESGDRVAADKHFRRATELGGQAGSGRDRDADAVDTARER